MSRKVNLILQIQMTLIVSVITDKYIVQVSDRRLTRPGYKNFKEEKANKVLVLDQRVAIGYTGISKFITAQDRDGVQVDRWITDTLATQSRVNIFDSCDYIAAEADEVFKCLIHKYYPRKYLAFVAVGWIPFVNGDLHPIICKISNAMNENGDWLETPEIKFTVRYKFLLSQELFKLDLAGYYLPVDQPEIEKLRRQIRSCVERDLGPKVVTDLIAASIRRLAGKYSAIGKNLMVVSLPKKQQQSNFLQMQEGEPNFGSNTFFYMRHDTQTGTAYNPNLILGNMVAYGNEHVGITRTESSTTATFAMRIIPKEEFTISYMKQNSK